MGKCGVGFGPVQDQLPPKAAAGPIQMHSKELPARTFAAAATSKAIDGMIVPAVVISKVPWIEARSAAELLRVARVPPLDGTSEAVPDRAVVPPTATVPRAPKSCIAGRIQGRG